MNDVIAPFPEALTDVLCIDFSPFEPSVLLVSGRGQIAT